MRKWDLKIAVIGDAMLDIAIEGDWVGQCPENSTIETLAGPNVRVYAGGAGNVVTVLTEHRVTADLFTDGPGKKDTEWVGELFKSAVRANRVVWSGQGNIAFKIRGYIGHDVAVRLDAEKNSGRKQPFVGLDFDASAYDAVIISDYCKSVVDKQTRNVIQCIVNEAKFCVVDSKRRDFSLWEGASMLVPNLTEADTIYGSKSPSQIRKMAKVDAVCITRDGSSSVASWGDGDVCIPIDSVVGNPYNVGAGDAFTAGVAIGMCKFGNCPDALFYAMELAGKYVQKPRKCHVR